MKVKNKYLMIAVMVACGILSAFVLTYVVIYGLAASNLVVALAMGKSVTGVVSEKSDTRGACYLVVDIDGYENLNYPCSEEVYDRYSIGDEVVIELDITVR